ncbi:MAG: helix-turn-helix domain-containing protein [Trebonia sp.]
MSNISGKIQPMEIHELIGAGVRAARERLGWRQEDAAREFRRHGLTTWRRSTVADVEAGRRHPSIGDLVLVATALEVTLADLIPDATERVEVGTGASVTALYVRVLLSGNLAAVGNLPADDWPEIPGDELDRAANSLMVAAEQVDQFVDSAEQLQAQQELALDDVRRQERIVRTYPQIRPLLAVAGHRIKAADVQHAYQSVPTDAEWRAANRLDIEPIVLKIASLALWGHSFEAERDQRANASSNDAPSAIQARRGHAARGMVTELGLYIHAAHQNDSGKEPDASDQDD